MEKANRAAQFLPFDTLTGLREELRRREEIHSRIERKEISEEKKEEISAALTRLERGDVVEITFYYNGHYVLLAERVTAKNVAFGFLTIGENKIFFDDIYEIKIL